MRVHRSIGVLLAIVGVAACSEFADPTAVTPQLEVAEDHTSGLYRVKGSGDYIITLASGTELEARFNMNVRQVAADGTARGRFRHRLLFNGELVDFTGVATCLVVDQANGRAWIGGVVHRNRSVAAPFADGEIYQPGKDIWFRVLDAEGDDRTTFTGFEGGAGIITSAEYCATQPWPAENARTNPIVKGKVKIKQR